VVELIPNGIEVPGCSQLVPERRAALRQSIGVAEDSVVIAAIGRLSPEKGYSHLVSAMARLCREQPATPARLIFLGEGDLLDALRQQATAEGVADRIVFAGFRTDVAELLQVIDVVVFSSFYEGLSIALLEAMAAARSLVVTDVPGNLDAVRANTEALVVPPADADSLAKALGGLVRDPGLRRRIGQAARERFLACFTADRMVEGYERVYRDVLEGRLRNR
jgi:glycosyltransferase involved in cell wall biosynthesis